MTALSRAAHQHEADESQTQLNYTIYQFETFGNANLQCINESPSHPTEPLMLTFLRVEFPGNFSVGSD
jgi:hypothetical protein